MFTIPFTLTPDSVIGLLSAGMALFFDYFPKVSVAFDALADDQKKLIVLGGSVVIAGAVFAGQCYGFLITSLVCSAPSIVNLLYGVVLSVAVAYGFHKATKP